MTIRTLFSTRRPIDRPIEKVIDYYATDDARLRSEIEEYEVTDNVEKCFSRFLDVYDAGFGLAKSLKSDCGLRVFMVPARARLQSISDLHSTTIGKSPVGRF